MARTKTEMLARCQVDSGEVRQALEARIYGDGRVRSSAVVEQLMEWLKDGMREGSR